HARGGEGQRARAVAALGRAGAGRVVQGDPDGGPRVEAAGAVDRCGGGEDLAAGDCGKRETGKGKRGQAAPRSGARDRIPGFGSRFRADASEEFEQRHRTGTGDWSMAGQVSRSETPSRGPEMAVAGGRIRG